MRIFFARCCTPVCVASIKRWHGPLQSTWRRLVLILVLVLAPVLLFFYQQLIHCSRWQGMSDESAVQTAIDVALPAYTKDCLPSVSRNKLASFEGMTFTQRGEFNIGMDQLPLEWPADTGVFTAELFELHAGALAGVFELPLRGGDTFGMSRFLLHAATTPSSPPATTSSSPPPAKRVCGTLDLAGDPSGLDLATLQESLAGVLGFDVNGKVHRMCLRPTERADSALSAAPRPEAPAAASSRAWEMIDPRLSFFVVVRLKQPQ